MQQRNSLRKDIHTQETPEVSDTKRSECWENYLQTTKEDDWIESLSCRNWLHEIYSPYKEKCVDYGKKVLRQKKQQDSEEDLEYFFH
jgi:hypothetical protein